ncbi:Hypothetical protein SRAE_X000028833 [Strongyloides ratti]|uniref:Uncharacterized protein n=1 Tax=Strongyloides ratti TaxID=34506 RepID=A0A090LTK1_STRRB|nr:Hypothetical protein SRAE_X000028833 [Strongyloides ratti]CEF70959.1 Hypothetical protein SRAE_X000028833 [Strongyloides ratti]
MFTFFLRNFMKNILIRKKNNISTNLFKEYHFSRKTCYESINNMIIEKHLYYKRRREMLKKLAESVKNDNALIIV